MRNTERIFELLGLEYQQKVRLASWQLKGESSYWWKIVEMEGIDIHWSGFRKRFERRFLSQTEESMQLEKFINLKQGSLSVKEYINQFNELSRFVMELVNTPHKKATKFAKGLNQPLQGWH